MTTYEQLLFKCKGIWPAKILVKCLQLLRFLMNFDRVEQEESEKQVKITIMQDDKIVKVE